MTDPETMTTIDVEGMPPRQEAPSEAYREALSRQPAAYRTDVLRTLGPYDRSLKPTELAPAIVDRLGETRFVEGLWERLGRGSRIALGLMALTENSIWPASGLAFALASLGEPFVPVASELLPLGLLVPRRLGDGPPPSDPERLLDPPGCDLVAPPAILSVGRTVLPEAEGPPASGPTRQVRETDGLEFILRLAALWQIVDEAPLRRTQTGSLYKRDRERIEDDPVLVGPIADALEPLPDMAGLWLSLARGVGLVIDDSQSDRTSAAPADFWSENAVHLPQMAAARWLGMRSWSEQGGSRSEDSPVGLAGPFLRPAVFLWLARKPAGEWVALDDLAALLDETFPGWSAPILGGAEPSGRGHFARKRGGEADSPGPLGGMDLLEAILLGPAYQIGLVRAAEEDPSGRRVVQLTELGRYSLALGPPPPPRTTFPHFLFVQPNFEVIAYRQGLNPGLIGQLSRFMRWSQAGAALEMKLTPESVYRGLEGGMSPDAMLDRLAKHSARPLPAGVAEAVKTWSNRRDRITYHGAATLVEFASPEVMAEALALWPEGSRPVPLSDRLLLVEDESTIPFARFRLAGSRDYRRPPEACVEVDPDGVTLSLDLGRSDLFIDAEIARIADELGDDRDSPSPAGRRRFRITTRSLRRAAEDGVSAASLTKWFAQRVGGEVPPAVRLLWHAVGPGSSPLTVTRPIVLNLPAADLLDGLLQHPATRDKLGDRLGPTAVVVPDGQIEPLREALRGFGMEIL